MKKTAEQPLLDFAATEVGVLRERLATLGNLCKVVGANCHQANVLRWLFDEGGCFHAVPIDVPRICGSPWILSCEATVRRDLLFWEQERIIEIERDRREGRFQAANAARLLWSSVLQRLVGRARSVASPPPSAAQSQAPGEGPERRTAEGDPQQCTGVNLVVNRTTSASTPDYLTWTGVLAEGPFSRNPMTAHARARGLLSLSSVCTVDDDVDRQDRQDRQVEFSAIWQVAEEARRPLYPANWPRDPQVKQVFVAGAVLACTVFSPQWIQAATRAAQAKSGATPWRYWIGCLRNGLVEIEGLPPFATRDEAASYLATLMNAAAPVALAVIAHCDHEQRPAAAEEDFAPREESPEAKLFREKCARHQAAKARGEAPR